MWYKKLYFAGYYVKNWQQEKRVIPTNLSFYDKRILRQSHQSVPICYDVKFVDDLSDWLTSAQSRFVQTVLALTDCYQNIS